MLTSQETDAAVKAIDLESAVPRAQPCVDYRPAYCPPEAALAFSQSPRAYAADPAYDAWSLGMMLLHVYSGSSWYGSAGNALVMAQLVQPEFAVDVSCVDDNSQQFHFGIAHDTKLTVVNRIE